MGFLQVGRARAGVHRVLASFSIASFRRYYAGRVCSLAGTTVAATVEGLWLAEHTHSGVWLALYGAAVALPFVLLGPWAGLLADRVSRRPLLLIAELLFMVNEGAMCVLSANHLLRPWLIVVVGGGTWSVIATFVSSAGATFVPEIVGEKLLSNGVSLDGSVGAVATIAGSIAAGVVVGTFGMTAAWAASALSSGALVIALCTIRPEHSPPQRASHALRDVLREVRLKRSLWAAVGAVVFPLVSPNLAAVLPLLTSELHGGAAGTLAVLKTAMASGAAAGSVLAAARRRIVPAIMLGAVGIAGAFESLLGAATSVTWEVLGLIGAGAMWAVFQNGMTAHLLRAGREDMRSSIIALYGTTTNLAGVLGGLLTGWLIDMVGVRVVLLVTGSVLALAGPAMFGTLIWLRRRSRAGI